MLGRALRRRAESISPRVTGTPILSAVSIAFSSSLHILELCAGEKWWGDFITLNGNEIQYLVDEHFIGDKLARNEIATDDGRRFDLRNVTSPIIVFTSLGDNISPPQQTLGWILDLFEDLDDIRGQGKTIVYCVDPKVGHLAIFVSPKVAVREHEGHRVLFNLSRPFALDRQICTDKYERLSLWLD